MPQLISRQEFPVMVDFNGWALQDWDDTQVPVLFPEGFEYGPFLGAYPGRLDFSSAGHTHTASLTVEVWDSVPDVPPGEWDESAEASVFCASGKMRARAVAGGPMPEQIVLSSDPCWWNVRVLCAGRQEVAEQAQQGAVHGVERYTAQFSPRD
ncbi:hypothetical protein [Streptomyces sp. NPDC087294]|uniref:hypothetical protein n=1 Tax=Streptomyces sp. NPDC087294 TaxID=3365777 RepID=UPI0038285FAF